MKKNHFHLFSLLMFLFVQSVFAQSITITGTVVSKEDNQPLPGASVFIKGSSSGVSTDFDGKFNLSATDTNGKTLVISFIGYTPVEINLTGQNQDLNIELELSATSLDEVVVTALGIRKEAKALGYSLTEVGGDELAEVKTTSAINSLQGRVAGVNISTSSTGAPGSSRVVIRGASSLSGDNQPLYVIDGIPIVNSTKASVQDEDGHFGDGGDDISGINPDDIETISVLKGAAAAALYGSLASNGVIMITTKTAKRDTGFGVEYSGSFTFSKS